MIRRLSSRRQKLAAGEGVTVRADPRLARDPVTSRTGSPWVTLDNFRPGSGLNEELQRLDAANLFAVVR
jgi:hypothetical protein